MRVCACWVARVMVGASCFLSGLSLFLRPAGGVWKGNIKSLPPPPPTQNRIHNLGDWGAGEEEEEEVVGCTRPGACH